MKGDYGIFKKQGGQDYPKIIKIFLRDEGNKK